MPYSSTELPAARLRERPQDFVVEEIPAYEPSGSGEHLFVTFRKIGLTTQQAMRRLAEALGADPRAAGIAGNKDRHAVTTQTVSFSLEGRPDADESALASLAPDIEVLSCQRHQHKLKTGHLRGNRFVITLRGIAPDEHAGIEARLKEIETQGVPNAFGPQRFGRYGDNAERAREWIIGGKKAPRDRRLRRLLFSALQSQLFNEVLARRVADGSWATVVAGDLAQKQDSGGVFWVEAEQLATDQERARSGAICATGPMFGTRMRWPREAPGEMEREVLDASGLHEDRLKQLAKLGRGARRPLRLWVEALCFSWEHTEGYLKTSFVLPKGAYATTVLSQVCNLIDATQSSPPNPHRDSPPAATPRPAGEAPPSAPNTKLVDAPSAEAQTPDPGSVPGR